MTLEKHYADNFEKYVGYLTGKISREEAEDRVQNVFLSLFARKEFCELLIQQDEFDKYVQGAINRQPAQALREKYRQVPTISIEPDNIDFLSSIRDTQHGGEVTNEVELNDFYGRATKLLENPREPISDCGFETVGELRQYIFTQYCRNGRTFEEIGELVGQSFANVSKHYARIMTILTPTAERFCRITLGKDKIDLRKS